MSPPGTHPLRELDDAVREVVREVAALGGPVAFDADGTLWRGDVGEELLRWLAHEGRLPAARGRHGVYAEYERRVARDPADAYAWSVEVMRGIEEAPLLEACEGLIRARFAGRLLRPVRLVLEALAASGCEVWIVSASPHWPVLAGARLLDVPERRVLAVSCQVAQGRLTGEVVKPVTCGDGKVEALRARGVRPRLSVGNGELDLPMLAYSERAIVVAPPDEDNALVREGQRRGWPVLRC